MPTLTLEFIPPLTDFFRVGKYLGVFPENAWERKSLLKSGFDKSIRATPKSHWQCAEVRAHFPRSMGPNFSSSVQAPDDEHLLRQVAHGDRVAFAELYDRFSTPLYSVALKMLGGEAEAQDLVQDVFLSIWNKASSYQPDRGSAFAWSMAQLRNRAIDNLRARQRHGELEEAHAPEIEPSGSFVATAADTASLHERAREVRSALRELSDEQREALRLAYFEGLTQMEIAEKLEEPLGTIKARVHRGMSKLRAALRFLHE